MPSHFLVDETLEIIRQLEKDLALHKLDPGKIDLNDINARRQIQALLDNLDTILNAAKKDPRALALVTRVKGLRDFIAVLREALAGHAKYQEWLTRQKTTPAEVNATIDRVINALKEWELLALQKVTAHLQGKSRNKYLENLPIPSQNDRFYVMVKELNHLQTLSVHPIDQGQLERQEKRTTKELIEYDEEDPISGNRYFAQGDSTTYPGSGIRITNGHHRLFELYRRYLHGEIDGDTLVLMKIEYVG